MRITLALMVLLLVGMTSTHAQQKWTQDRFEIGGWIVPPVSFHTDAVFGQMEAAGFTLMTGPHQRDNEDVQSNKRFLDLCRRHGLRYIVRDSRMHLDPQTDEDKHALDAMIADYKGHPALYGYFLMDEPKPSDYRRLAGLHAYLQAKDPSHLTYINLYPNYGGPDQLEFPDYDGYVKGFIDAVHPLMLSYDHYPFLKTRDRDNWFANLEVVRRDSLKQGIPMWVIIQALQDATRYRPPTLNQMYWQVNTALAYGAKSIWYFPYWSVGKPDKPEEWHYLGVILPDGRPGPQFEAAKEINPQLKALGPLLMGLKSVSVTHLGNVPLRGEPFHADDLIASAHGDQIVIGRFEDRLGKPVLILANRDWDKPGKVGITLKEGISVEDAGRIGPGQPLSKVQWNTSVRELSLTLAPAEGRIVRIVDR